MSGRPVVTAATVLDFLKASWDHTVFKAGEEFYPDSWKCENLAYALRCVANAEARPPKPKRKPPPIIEYGCKFLKKLPAERADKEAADITTLSSPTHISLSGGNVTISFSGVATYQYTLERSTNLSTGAGWVPIVTTNATSNTVFTITDTFSDIGSRPGMAFYRFLVP